jgi:hypothetical protein
MVAGSSPAGIAKYPSETISYRFEHETNFRAFARVSTMSATGDEKARLMAAGQLFAKPDQQGREVGRSEK